MIKVTRILICLSIVKGRADATGNGMVLATRYLTEFGYIDTSKDSMSRKSLHHQNFSRSLREFQSFMGLRETGVLDKSTLYSMKIRRCGNKDIKSSPNRRYNLLQNKWPFSNITYGFENYPRTMNRQMTASTIKKAFNLWSRVVPLKFKQTKFQNSNIKISFLVGDHGDEAPFKNAGDEEDEQQLAHSKEYPSGIIHFFDGLEWSVGSLKGEDLLQVAAHEIGHVLGLDHSNNKLALMYPTCVRYHDNVKLGEDDIKGIQAIYGKKENVKHKHREQKLGGKSHIKNVKKKVYRS